MMKELLIVLLTAVAFSAPTCSANKCQGGCWVERHGEEAICDTLGKTANERNCLDYGKSQTDNGVSAKTTWCPSSSGSGLPKKGEECLGFDVEPCETGYICEDPKYRGVNMNSCPAKTCTCGDSSTRINWKMLMTHGSAQRQKFGKKGDHLLFQEVEESNIYLMPNKEAFDDCNFKEAVLLSNIGPYMYQITQRETYFACSMKKRCKVYGQKLQFSAPAPINWKMLLTQSSAQTQMIGKKGDHLLFEEVEFGGSNISLMPNKEAFDDCNFKEAVLLEKSGPYIFQITQRETYFASSVSNYCKEHGQKLQFSAPVH